MPGPMTRSAGDVLRQALIDAGLVADPPASGWQIRLSHEPDRPDDHVTVYDRGAIDLGKTMPDDERQTRPVIQIRVRSADYRAGWAKANAIAIALDGFYGLGVSVLGTDYVIHAVRRAGDPLHIGKDTPEGKRDVFVINCDLSVRQVS